ncbi:MAG: DNA polymerase III subunit beta, partial [Granulosicoccaceae bacterium]
MKFSLSREELLQPLQRVIGAVERRNTLAILGNVLITAENGNLYLTATDTEIELSDSVAANIETEGEATLPARKLFDICKTLSDGADIKIDVSDEKALVRS